MPRSKYSLHVLYFLESVSNIDDLSNIALPYKTPHREFGKELNIYHNIYDKKSISFLSKNKS